MARRNARTLTLTSAVLLCLGAYQAPADDNLGRTHLEAQQQEVEVFVRLATPSVADLNIESMAATGEMASADAQRRQAASVDAEQASVRPQLQAIGVTELSSQRVGANGFRVRARVADMESLRSLPGVRSVGRVETHVMDNAESVPWVGAPAVWERLDVRGEGIRVGIIVPRTT